jgi:gas vesicle protein
MGRFKKGLFLGGLIGAGLMWLGVTPRGKELRARVREHLDPLFIEIQEAMKQLEGPTREMYEALVDRVVEEYGARKHLAYDIKDGLVRELKKRWEDVSG